MELINCMKCGTLMLKNPVDDICKDCLKEEEKAYEIVYKYIRKRRNKSVSIDEVVEETDVEEELIYKFIRKGRINVVEFPNLGYPCEVCGNIIRKGKVCDSCSKDIQSQIHALEEETNKNNDSKNHAYYIINRRNGNS